MTTFFFHQQRPSLMSLPVSSSGWLRLKASGGKFDVKETQRRLIEPGVFQHM